MRAVLPNSSSASTLNPLSRESSNRLSRALRTWLNTVSTSGGPSPLIASAESSRSTAA